MYAALGLYRAAIFPLAYAMISTVSLPLAIATNRFDIFRLSQLSMMAVLPFLLQWQLGGIARSGAVMVWSFWTPLYALITGGAREWQGWLGAFFALVAVSGILEHPIGHRSADATGAQCRLHHREYRWPGVRHDDAHAICRPGAQ